MDSRCVSRFLDGVIIKRWSISADRTLKRFCGHHHYDDLLIRIDTLDKRWSERRGGYIIHAHEARRAIKGLNREGKIAAFLEPLSPYRDLYSMAAITDSAQDNMSIEIVGPGFDASDLLRGDSLPHERVEAFVRNGRGFEKSIHIISEEDYKRSVKNRFVKIGARLKNPGSPREILSSAAVDPGNLAQEAMAFLRETNQTTLVHNMNSYRPIPKRLLQRFILGVGKIFEGLERYNIRLGATSFSATFTTRGRFVFWDFFPADLTKAKLLYLDL